MSTFGFSVTRISSIFTAVVISAAAFLMSTSFGEAQNRKHGASVSGGVKYYNRSHGKRNFTRHQPSRYGLAQNNRVNFGAHRSGARLGAVTGLRRNPAARSGYVHRGNDRQYLKNRIHRGQNRFHGTARNNLRNQRSGVRFGNAPTARSGYVRRDNHKYTGRRIHKGQNRVYGNARNQFRNQNSGVRVNSNNVRQFQNGGIVPVYDNDDFYYTEVIPTGPRPITKCPSNFNCGYRLYEDGTGPRVIVPGLDDTGLPEQDGIRGPRVITLD